jgi:hypothetical protein
MLLGYIGFNMVERYEGAEPPCPQKKILTLKIFIL